MIGRILLWSFPLVFAGANPRHGYEWDMKLLFEGPWVLGAIVGLSRNPRKDARIFYGVWLLGLFALEVWGFFLPATARLLLGTGN